MQITMRSLSATGVLALGLCGAASNANAEVTSFTVEFSVPAGTYSGHDYIYIEALMEGTVTRPDTSTGSYRAPVAAFIPTDGGTDLGYIDVTNSSYVSSFFQLCGRGVAFCGEGVGERGNKLEDQVYMQTRIIQGPDFMFEQGATLMAIGWDRAVTELMGDDPPVGTRRGVVYGTIEAATDGYQIVRDAASFLKDPSTFDANGHDVGAPMATTHVIAQGNSQSAQVLNFMTKFGLNGDNLIDGMLIGSAGGLCWGMNDNLAPGYGQPFPCHLDFSDPGNPQPEFSWPVGDTKIIASNTETDVLWISAGDLMRFSNLGEGAPDNYRLYEIAGVAHLPPPVFPFSWLLSEEAPTNIGNPADFRPFVRASVSSLIAWVKDGTAPPPSVFVEAGTNPENGQIYRITDEDDNVLGGVRLPHMQTTLEGETVVGAPTGRYGGTADLASTGVDYLPLPFEPGPETNIFIGFMGTYDRFSDDELAERYPTEEDYQTRVGAAADYAFEQGWILAEDRDAYKAEREPQPQLPEVDDKESMDDPGDDSCSTSGGSSSLVSWMLVLGAVVALRRRKRAART